jgi:serine/threonine protein kinase
MEEASSYVRDIKHVKDALSDKMLEILSPIDSKRIYADSLELLLFLVHDSLDPLGIGEFQWKKIEESRKKREKYLIRYTDGKIWNVTRTIGAGAFGCIFFGKEKTKDEKGNTVERQVALKISMSTGKNGYGECVLLQEIENLRRTNNEKLEINTPVSYTIGVIEPTHASHLLKEVPVEGGVCADIKRGNINMPTVLYAISMEFVTDGDALKYFIGTEYKIVERIQTVTEIIVSLCKTIDILRDKFGVVHRDIKPANLLMKVNKRSDGTVGIKCLLADFGLSLFNTKEVKQAGGYGAFTTGTSGYVPPDALTTPQDGSTLPGGEFDTWAMGLVCLDLLLIGNTTLPAYDSGKDVKRYNASMFNKYGVYTGDKSIALLCINTHDVSTGNINVISKAVEKAFPESIRTSKGDKETIKAISEGIVGSFVLIMCLNTKYEKPKPRNLVPLPPPPPLPPLPPPPPPPVVKLSIGAQSKTKRKPTNKPPKPKPLPTTSTKELYGRLTGDMSKPKKQQFDFFTQTDTKLIYDYIIDEITKNKGAELILFAKECLIIEPKDRSKKFSEMDSYKKLLHVVETKKSP